MDDNANPNVPGSNPVAGSDQGGQMPNTGVPPVQQPEPAQPTEQPQVPPSEPAVPQPEPTVPGQTTPEPTNPTVGA